MDGYDTSYFMGFKICEYIKIGEGKARNEENKC